MRANFRRWDLWLAGAALLGFCAIAATLDLPAEEDAFIYYRYAWNSAHGHGLVFNLGDPVEGFSGPVWMGVLALVARAGFDLPTTAPVLGVLCGAATLGATWFLGRAAGLDRFGRLAALIVLAISYPFIVWSRSGLETPFFSLALTVTTAAYLAAEYPVGEKSRKSRWIAAAALMLVCLGRPEGFLLVLILIADRLTDGRDVPGALRYALPAVLCYGAYDVWRVHTFHSLVPNTSVKLYPLLLDRSFSQFFAYVRYLGILPLCLPVLTLATSRGTRQERRRLGVLFGVVCVLSFGFVFLAGGDYRPGFRYFVPTLPLLLVAIWLAPGLSSLELPARGSGPGAGGRRKIAPIFLVVLVGLLVIGPLRMLWRNPPHLQSPTPEPDIALWLDGHTAQNAVVAFGQMGQVPYALARRGHDITFIDTLGLVDRDIARIYRFDSKMAALWRDVRAGMSVSEALEAGRRDRADRVAASILARQPDVILIETALADYRMMRALSNNAPFRAAYRDLGGFPAEGSAEVTIYTRAAASSAR